jgi:hypothetical protein
MAAPTKRYRVWLLAGLVALACVITALGASSRAGAAPASARDDNHLTCGGFFRRGTGVTQIVVRAEKKKEEDSWSLRPLWMSVEGTPGWVGEPGFSWETQGGLFRGCSNAITYAVSTGRGQSALIGIALAQSFGGGAAGRTISCDVLAVSPSNSHFTCHRTREDTLNGQLDVWFRITSP